MIYHLKRPVIIVVPAGPRVVSDPPLFHPGPGGGRPREEVKPMELEKLTALISESAGRLVKATKLSRRDEKWWAALAKEDWNLIQLSWALRGVILKRGKKFDLDEKARKELEEILKKAEES